MIDGQLIKPFSDGSDGITFIINQKKQISAAQAIHAHTRQFGVSKQTKG